jgi:predicted AAA+ superfamily ATPase
MKERYLSPFVKEELKEKMVFMGGPRQVGKTTMSFSLLKNGNKNHPAYFNWDITNRRQAIVAGNFPPRQKLIILDEVHKYARWRNLLKGFYDQYVPDVNFIVTGSAKLDYYRRGGDSLHGRYFYYRLHPLSVTELGISSSAQIQQLLHLGGFPEPYYRGSETFARRWRRARLERVLQEDLRDLEKVQEVSLVELLVDSLPPRICTPLSVNSLAKSLEVVPATVERWIKILERLYLCFRVPPYGEERIRAVRKEQKLYFWDWSMAPEGGARFENMVASHLLKYCHFLEDTEGYKMELRYIKDLDGREVDFIVLKDRKPQFAVECKLSEKDASPSMKYYLERTKVPKFFQVHLDSKADYLANSPHIRVLPFLTLCQELGLP